MPARLRFALPTTIPEAERLLGHLKRERRRIEQQLDDPIRPTREDSIKAYAEWRDRAKRALKHVISETSKTEDWLALIKPTLMERLYELLRTLEEEVDLDPQELALIRELEAHCKPEPKEIICPRRS